FRTHGPSGGNDEFVEIYNNTDGPIDISGWKLNGSNTAGTTSTRATVGAGTIVQARRHYLFVNTAANGYSGTVTGDKTYATGITDDGGLAILMADNTVVDQVGMSATSAYKEVTTLTPQTASLDKSYERKVGGVEGSRQDTNDNSADFLLRNGSAPQNSLSEP